jgi:hypothetical protein
LLEKSVENMTFKRKFKDFLAIFFLVNEEYLTEYFFLKKTFAKKKHCPRTPPPTVSATGEFSPNFDLKNMISTYTKDFSWEMK